MGPDFKPPGSSGLGGGGQGPRAGGRGAGGPGAGLRRGQAEAGCRGPWAGGRGPAWWGPRGRDGGCREGVRAPRSVGASRVPGRSGRRGSGPPGSPGGPGLLGRGRRSWAGEGRAPGPEPGGARGAPGSPGAGEAPRPSPAAGRGAAPPDISSCRRRRRAQPAASFPAERGPREARAGRRAPGPAAGTTEPPHGRRQRWAAAPGPRRGKRRRRGGGGGAMEPQEVKDRILENISLSVKKVSAACAPRPGPATPASAPCFRRAGGPACSRGAGTPPFPPATPGTGGRGSPGSRRGSGAAHVSAAAAELFLKNKVEVSIVRGPTSRARGPRVTSGGRDPPYPPPEQRKTRRTSGRRASPGGIPASPIPGRPRRAPQPGQRRG